MRANAVKARWRAGETALGAWLSLPSALSAEIMAREAFDYVCIDMQHGGIDYQAALGMIQAIDAAGGTPFARVPWNEPGVIMKLLDAGALGVVVPMVNSVAEAEAAVAACRYHPAGARSFGPLRAGMVHGPDYFARANDEVACIPMIETERALDSLDAILAVPGIDAVYVGPADLSITLGLPPGMDNGGRFEEARQAIAAACARHGVVAGIHASAALAAKHTAAGYRMVTISSDQGGMRAAARADLERARGG